MRSNLVVPVLALLLAVSIAFPALLAAGEACTGKAGSVTVDSVRAEGGMVDIAGGWKASPGTQGLGIEVRIDQDRQALEVHSGESGTWSAKVPFALCGRHVLRVYAFAAVPEEGHTTLCFEGAPSTPHPFDVDCTPQAHLESCAIDCPKPKTEPGKGKKAQPAPAPAPIECKATCTGRGSGGTGTLAGLAGVNGANVQFLEGPGGGPWTFTLACKPGDKVTFLVRDRSGVGASSKTIEKECVPK